MRVARDVDRNVHRDRAVAGAVVVQRALGGVGPVGDRRDRLAVEPLALSEDLAPRRDAFVGAEAVEDRLEARLAGPAGGDLRVRSPRPR